MAKGKAPFRAIVEIDRDALESFQAGIRKRYSDEQILDELRASADRLGRSPTMREFAADSAAPTIRTRGLCPCVRLKRPVETLELVT